MRSAVVVGAGMAGLATAGALARAGWQVTVLERNPAGVTYGWGVVFWDDLLDDLFRYDPVSARRIWDAACKWDEYEIRATGKPGVLADRLSGGRAGNERRAERERRVLQRWTKPLGRGRTFDDRTLAGALAHRQEPPAGVFRA